MGFHFVLMATSQMRTTPTTHVLVHPTTPRMSELDTPHSHRLTWLYHLPPPHLFTSRKGDRQGAGNEDEGGNDEGGKEDEGRNEDEGGDGVGGVSGGERERKWGGRDDKDKDKDKDKDRDKGKVEADKDDEINNVDHRNSEHSNEKDKVDEYECGEDEVDEYKHREDGQDDYLPDQRHNSEDNTSFTGGHEALSDLILAPLTKSLRICTSGAPCPGSLVAHSIQEGPGGSIQVTRQVNAEDPHPQDTAQGQQQQCPVWNLHSQGP
ncbi:hypothetical protein PAXINDRAFT_157785 [Paxillus involutus ATCC 200175]|uniref:Unplaced genomic scaffold PAXINscaffold_104, whole genome shotgun sequence n=1 Tax=Paxillus involutus ATCC 200175 TaxID=664439 RepID=A0A0C9TGI6_PAXIN|nr:hypothetical protein PAXINDRAFT_157785 [Paxillus involutus ATCC 200175]